MRIPEKIQANRISEGKKKLRADLMSRINWNILKINKTTDHYTFNV